MKRTKVYHYPELARLLEGVPLEQALRYEFDSVCYFRERAHLFCAPIVPAEDDFLEWLALMQHFSAPTRMLDWTSSFTTALYFAVSEEPFDEPGAVWLVHAVPLWRRMHQQYGDSDLKDENKKRAIFSNADNFVSFGVDRARPLLDGYDPNRKSERVTAQRGVFTICEKLFVDHATIIGEALLSAYVPGQNIPLCAGRVTSSLLIPLKKSHFDLFAPVFGLDNEGGPAIFRGFSAESIIHYWGQANRETAY